MGEITIHFDGICTQISQLPPDFGIAAAHRVVLVHGEHGHLVAGKQIPPHVATLDVGDGVTPVSHLEGAHLRIANAVPGRICYDASYLNVPGLRTHNSDLAPLKRDVVAGTDAAAHFDVTSGTFASEPIHHGAWRSMLTVQTTDEPTLVITPFAGGPQQTLHLRSGSTIIVANTGNKLVPESEFDFYLHYLVTEKVPTHPYFPPPDGGRNDLLGPGCSNSNYP
jgi:hypothetical protein